MPMKCSTCNLPPCPIEMPNHTCFGSKDGINVNDLYCHGHAENPTTPAAFYDDKDFGKFDLSSIPKPDDTVTTIYLDPTPPAADTLRETVENIISKADVGAGFHPAVDAILSLLASERQRIAEVCLGAVPKKEITRIDRKTDNDQILNGWNDAHDSLLTALKNEGIEVKE